MSMNERNKQGMELHEKAKEHIKIVDYMLGIVRYKLVELDNEIEDCTPAEYDALERANRLSHELYVVVIETLSSVKGRKKEFRNGRGDES
jgi:hypothetical protein